MYVCIELGDIPVLSLHRDKKLIMPFFQKTVGVINRLRANKNFNCALRNAVTGARETQRIDCFVGG